MLRNPEDMPSACYLPSHPPGKRQGRQAHCAELPPRRWAAGCAGPWQERGPGCSRGGSPRRSGGPRALGLRPLGQPQLLGPRSTGGSEDRRVPAEMTRASGWPAGSPPPVLGPWGPWGRGGGTWEMGVRVTWCRGGGQGGGEVEEEMEGRCCRYWALTRVSLREGLSFGQRARSKCA